MSNSAQGYTNIDVENQRFPEEKHLEMVGFPDLC